MKYYSLLFLLIFFACSQESEKAEKWTKSDKKENSQVDTIVESTKAVEEKVENHNLVLSFKFPSSFVGKKVAVQYNNGRAFQEFLSLKIDSSAYLSTHFTRLNETLYRLIVDQRVIFVYPDVDTIRAEVKVSGTALALQNCNSFETQEVQDYTVYLSTLESSPNASDKVLDYLKNRPAFYIDYLYARDLTTGYRGNREFFDRLREEFSDKSKYPYAKETDVLFATKAPEIALNNPQGEEIKLSDFKGKIVLIDFWASWCGPCRLTNPALVEFYTNNKGEGFEILGVSLDVNKEAWVRGIKEDGLEWPQVTEFKKWDAKAAQAYGINSIPQSVIVDQEGNLVAKVPGQSSPKATIDEIQSIVNSLK